MEQVRFGMVGFGAMALEHARYMLRDLSLIHI